MINCLLVAQKVFFTINFCHKFMALENFCKKCNNLTLFSGCHPCRRSFVAWTRAIHCLSGRTCDNIVSTNQSLYVILKARFSRVLASALIQDRSGQEERRRVQIRQIGKRSWARRRRTWTEETTRRISSQNQRTRNIFSFRALTPRTQRASTFCRVPLGPYIRKSHLVILGKTLLRGSNLFSSSCNCQRSASAPKCQNSPPRKVLVRRRLATTTTRLATSQSSRWMSSFPLPTPSLVLCSRYSAILSILSQGTPRRWSPNSLTSSSSSSCASSSSSSWRRRAAVLPPSSAWGKESWFLY